MSGYQTSQMLTLLIITSRELPFQSKEHWWTEGMWPAGPELSQQGHTELHKKRSSLFSDVEQW